MYVEWECVFRVGVCMYRGSAYVEGECVCRGECV